MFKDLNQRLINAQESFISCVMEMGGLTQEEAEKVLRLYSKAKVVKLSPNDGQFRVVHGAYLDKHTLQTTASLIER